MVTRASWSSSTPGYDVTRLAFLLADLPVELLGRLRSDRVMQLPGAAAPGELLHHACTRLA
jgi:hypothetical protein